MPIRTVNVTEAPQKLKSTFAQTNTDFATVLEAMKGVHGDARKTTAFIVDMADPGWTALNEAKTAKYPKPEGVFASFLKRRFEEMGLGLTAYPTGKMQVCVRPKTVAELAKKKK